ncbi:hypothetical protein [Nocardia amamiensis]|uniref:hypothetical protein n=1 Tax=Nocardia TaxID=1817 RepID=UPI003410555C
MHTRTVQQPCPVRRIGHTRRRLHSTGRTATPRPEIAAQTLASSLYYQNWYLALSWSDYLAADPSSVSPLQHLWSMAVQAQLTVTRLSLFPPAPGHEAG